MFARDEEVILRRLGAGDLVPFQAYRGDPDVARFQDWAAMSDAQALGFLKAMSRVTAPVPGDWVQIAIAAEGAPALLGDIGVFLSDDSARAEIGITLSAAAQGRGLATRAYRLASGWVFKTTNARLIEGITDARNLKSQAMFDRLGMAHSATLGPEPDTPELVEYVYTLSRLD